MVMMISFSKIDIEKFDHVQRLMNNKEIKTLAEIKQEIDQIAKKQNINDLVNTKLNQDGLEVSFSSVAQFEKSSWAINDIKIQKLNPILLKVAEESQARQIEIIGHSDDSHMKISVGNVQVDNWSLSALRAHSLQQYLIGLNLKLENTKLIAYADTKPIVVIRNDMKPEDVERARNANRRVSIIIGKML
jgi:flagellar motor protein MotB